MLTPHHSAAAISWRQDLPSGWNGELAAIGRAASPKRHNGHGPGGALIQADRGHLSASLDTSACWAIWPAQAPAESGPRQRRREEKWHAIARALQRSDRQKTQFMATLGHELRNPLAALSQALQVLQRQSDPTAVLQSSCELMQRQLDQLLRLVDDMLDIERIAQGKIELQTQAIRVQDLVRNALAISEPALRQRGQHLEVDLPDAAIVLRADAMRLTQVLVNLLNNAAKYTPRGGRVALRARVQSQRAVIEVQDDGIGIAAADLPLVFDLYTQVARNLPMAQGGLGMGLAIARQLVELHGGNITVASPGVDQGSVFTIEIPVCQTATPSPAASLDHNRSALACPAPVTGSVWRILVVDDNKDGADTLAAALQCIGHQTLVAYDGAGALELANRHRPDAALVDLSMPGMDGFELAAALHRAGLKAALVAMTGWGSEADRQRCQAAGFHAHIAKPADLDRIGAVLSDLIGQGQSEPVCDQSPVNRV